MPRDGVDISIVIPTLNEAQAIGATLEAVSRLQGRFELLVVDGGSEDGTVDIVRRAGHRAIVCERGRGCQMHTGAAAASGDVLWFLHADTHPPAQAADRILEALARPDVVGGNFALLFDGGATPARLLTRAYPSFRLLGLSYGDSGIFVRTVVYREIGGFRPYPIFEDLDLIKRVKRRGRFVHLPCELVTSSRRFEGRSFTLTFARWTAMQVLYWAGVSPNLLGRIYSPVRDRGTGHWPAKIPKE